MVTRDDVVQVRRPPRRTPIEAALRHPVLALGPAVLLLVLLVSMAAAESPEYTAESRLVVGRVDVEAQSVPGFVAANDSLAATYARLVGTTEHLQQIADDSGRTIESIQGLLSASPIPESPIIVLEASGADESDAMELADDATTALIALVDRLNDPSERGAALLDEYRSASLDLAAASLERDLLEAQVNALRAEGVSPERVQAAEEALNEAEAIVAEADLRADTLGDLYRESQRARSDSELLRPVAEAVSLGSGRNQALLVAGLSAVLVGLLVGVALAWVVENWSELRGSTAKPSQPAFEPPPSGPEVRRVVERTGA